MVTFEPKLQLTQEPDGEYTLHTVTITPSSAYSAGRAIQQPPANVRLFPEVLPVLLHLRMRRGPALQVLTPVRHRLHNLQIGPAFGKTSLTAFVILNNAVVGSASVQVNDPCTTPNPDPRPVQTADWYAWLNRMPPGPPSFHMTGTVLLPHPGYEARLVKAAPQGINIRELILDLLLQERPGFWPQVVTPVSVRYDEAPAGIDYTGVLIRIPGTDAIQLDVEEVF
jgi:hypothetical protein